MQTTHTTIEDLKMAIQVEEGTFQAMIDRIHAQGAVPTEKQLTDLDRQAGYINGMIYALSIAQEGFKNA